jgi:hypothetical protein
MVVQQIEKENKALLQQERRQNKIKKLHPGILKGFNVNNRG